MRRRLLPLFAVCLLSCLPALAQERISTWRATLPLPAPMTVVDAVAYGDHLLALIPDYGRFLVGDVDGDNVADVIMTTKQPDDTEELAVAFGSAQGPPAPARTAGRVASGSSLHVGKSVSPTGAVDDVFVLTPHDSEVVAGTNDVQISVVLPSADRQLAAPLLFPAPDPTFVRVDSWRAHTPLIGPFSRVDRNDLLAFAVGVRDFDAEPTRGPVTLWRSRGTGPEAFEALANPRLVLEAESRRPGVKPDARLLLYGATGDLDRGCNGVEEIVRVANPAACLFSYSAADDGSYQSQSTLADEAGPFGAPKGTKKLRWVTRSWNPLNADASTYLAEYSMYEGDDNVYFFDATALPTNKGLF